MPDLQIYSLEWCPYCIKAKALLKAKEIPYRETDVTYDREQALEMIERSGRNSVPQIFLDDEHVGGYAELARLTSTGELDKAFGRQGRPNSGPSMTWRSSAAAPRASPPPCTRRARACPRSSSPRTSAARSGSPGTSSTTRATSTSPDRNSPSG